MALLLYFFACFVMIIVLTFQYTFFFCFILSARAGATIDFGKKLSPVARKILLELLHKELEKPCREGMDMDALQADMEIMDALLVLGSGDS
jgi:hypothetical protein